MRVDAVKRGAVAEFGGARSRSGGMGCRRRRARRVGVPVEQGPFPAGKRVPHNGCLRLRPKEVPNQVVRLDSVRLERLQVHDLAN